MSESKSTARLARYYSLSHKYNCAESTYTAAMESLGRYCCHDAVKALSAFGGGIGGKGETCGALAGCVGAIGTLLVAGQAQTSPNMRASAGLFHDRFVEKFGSIRCADLKPRFFTEECRCADLVEQAAALFDEVYKEITAKAE